jgi:hypothetical protein
MNRLKLGPDNYFQNWGEVWRGDYATAKKLRWALAATGTPVVAIVTECPNHGGAYDCTPFCPVCAGQQETTTKGE